MPWRPARTARSTSRAGLRALTKPPPGPACEHAGRVCEIADGEDRLPQHQAREAAGPGAEVVQRTPAHVAVARMCVLCIEAALAAAVAPAHERIAPAGAPGAVVEDRVGDVRDAIAAFE